MKILCTICARGSSKGVRNKNIRRLLGRPLITYTIRQALSHDLIDRVVVSTDSEEIAGISKDCGAEVPFLRPAALAGDSSAKLPVIQHAVRYYIDEVGYKPDYVIDLDPTSPLRDDIDITRCVELITSDAGCDSVITGYRSNKNPYFNMVELAGEGYATVSKKTPSVIKRRQDAPLVYAMNASVYAWRTESLLSQRDIISGRVKFVEMPEERSVDIDSELDFRVVESLMEERKKDDISRKVSIKR